MNILPVVTFDFETDPIGIDNGPYPDPVCASFYDPRVQETPWLLVVDADDVEGELVRILTDAAEGKCRIVNQYIAFDLRVAVRKWPHLWGLIRRVYEVGGFGDPGIREKLLDLSYHGNIGYEPTPSGELIQKAYNLAAFVSKYVGLDISETKSASSWRTKFGTLRGIPRILWPADAINYVLGDAAFAAAVWESQQIPGCGVEYGPGYAEAVHLRADFVHTSMTDRGMLLDPVEAQRLWDDTRDRMDVSNFPKLQAAGIVIPAVPPMPYANGAKNPDGTPKMKQAVPEKKSTKVLRQHCIASARDLGIQLELTDKGITEFESVYGKRKRKLPADHEAFDTNPEWASYGAGTIKALAEAGDTIAQEMEARQEVEKLVTSYFPALMWDFGNDLSGKKALRCVAGTTTPPEGWLYERANIRFAPLVRSNFDVLKETGRSSSYGGDLYPSSNGQQVDPRIRPLYVARPGYILVSRDYSALELFSAAWTWKNEVGYSVLFDLLVAGRKPHDYLAASLSFRMDPYSPVQGNTPDEWYESFLKLEESDPEYHKKWRKLAKAVGLGFPGGLGIETFVVFAWSTYGVHITSEDAKIARDAWLDTYPEARQYLKEWLYENALDHQWCTVDEDGDDVQRFWYTSPLGMVRRNCTYSQAANGKSLQTPSGEGFKWASWKVYCATQDPESPLYGAHKLLDIHDEMLVEIPIHSDYARTQAAIDELGRLMEEGMGEVMPGLDFKTEVEVMYRWLKYPTKEMTEAGIKSVGMKTPEGWMVPTDPYPEAFYEDILVPF